MKNSTLSPQDIARLVEGSQGEVWPDHPNPSYHNMRRTGFKLAYRRPNYIFQASSVNIE